MGAYGFGQGYFGQYALGTAGGSTVLDLIATVGVPVDLSASEGLLPLDLSATADPVLDLDASKG